MGGAPKSSIGGLGCTSFGITQQKCIERVRPNASDTRGIDKDIGLEPAQYLHLDLSLQVNL
jgi:hypothetical protein